MRHRPIKMLSIEPYIYDDEHIGFLLFSYFRLEGLHILCWKRSNSKSTIVPPGQSATYMKSITRKGQGRGRASGVEEFVWKYSRAESHVKTTSLVKTGDLHAFSWQTLHSPTNHLSLRVRRWLMLRSLTGQWTLDTTLHDWTLSWLYDAMATNRWP